MSDTYQTPLPPEPPLGKQTKLTPLRIVAISIAILLVLGATLAVVGYYSVQVTPGYKDQDLKDAEAAIAQFHERLNAKQFQSIVDAADEQVRALRGEDVMVSSLEALTQKYGLLRSVDALRSNVIVGAPIQVRAVCNVSFEKGQAYELFVFVKRGSELKLVNYQIFDGHAQLP